MSERAEAADPYLCKLLEGYMASEGVCLHATKVLRMLYAGEVDAANLLKGLNRCISILGILRIRHSIKDRKRKL